MKGNAIGHIGISLCCLAAAAGIQGCGASGSNGKTEIEIVQYKPEAAGYFDMLEEKVNASHDDIQLKISSPNDAMAILCVRRSGTSTGRRGLSWGCTATCSTIRSKKGKNW